MPLLLALVALFVAAQDAPDPYTLPIGPPARRSQAILQPGALYDLRSGKTASVADVATAADGVSFVFVGESHDNPEHHRFQADVIRALAERGRSVIVGMEMFPRSSQTALDLWTLGRLSEEEFIARSDWQTVWGFDYALYRPIFETVRENGLRLVGLNIPRDLTRKVARDGLRALTPDEKGTMPDLDLSGDEHRTLFNAMIGGAGGHMGSDNIYAAQVLWDTAMADTAINYWERTLRTSRTVFVLLAGSGHVMYGLGIEHRLKRRLDTRTLTVSATESEDALSVTRSIADFLLVTAKRD